MIKSNDKCPTCKLGHVVIRTNSKTNQQFLGCNTFPECKASWPYINDDSENNEYYSWQKSESARLDDLDEDYANIFNIYGKTEEYEGE